MCPWNWGFSEILGIHVFFFLFFDSVFVCFLLFSDRNVLVLTVLLDLKDLQIWFPRQEQMDAL